MKAMPLLVLFLFGGCASTYQVYPSQPADKHNGLSLRECNDRVEGATTLIELKKGPRIHANLVHVSYDSTIYVNDTSHARAGIPTAEIRCIVMVDHGAGALKGLTFGAIGGGLVGCVTGLTADRSGDVIRPNAGEMLLVSAIGGGCCGAIFGLIGGYTETLEFMDSSSVVR